MGIVAYPIISDGISVEPGLLQKRTDSRPVHGGDPEELDADLALPVLSCAWSFVGHAAVGDDHPGLQGNLDLDQVSGIEAPSHDHAAAAEPHDLREAELLTLDSAEGTHPDRVLGSNPREPSPV
ncbi:MAG: hypothetical protein R3234_06945, partial [Thermoanaerobaculia bacterium]|nr:hypothetical protein [Thermoanaerobaculia bacterium]